MNPGDCVCFKPTHLEEEMGLDEAILFYRGEIAEGSMEREHFERLAALFRHRRRFRDEIRVLQKAVAVYERVFFGEEIQSALPTLNMFAGRLKEARSQLAQHKSRRTSTRKQKRRRAPVGQRTGSKQRSGTSRVAGG